ncbi:AbrB/MazE/SpoVT family DNA-binding domain-containing protein [Parafilimonas sp.]|uniref:AbrB/MazE/SpoVT family DNA-binding domain-containing protein n=1 Tax=Parafilimonas sp. TaxID=1969739 RepID=UPI0039E4C4B7
METSVLTIKGQLLIPKRIRNKYGIQSGVKIIFEETDNGVIIRPMNENYFKSFKGILKSTGSLKEEMHQMKAEEKREERKLRVPAKTKKLK